MSFNKVLDCIVINNIETQSVGLIDKDNLLQTYNEKCRLYEENLGILSYKFNKEISIKEEIINKINYLVNKRMKELDNLIKLNKEDIIELLKNFEEFNKIVMNQFEEYAKNNIKSSNSKIFPDEDSLIKTYSSTLNSIERFIEFYLKVHEIIQTSQQTMNAEHEYKISVIEFKSNYDFYIRFLIEVLSGLNSFPVLILKFIKKSFINPDELFESYIDMSQYSFLIIQNYYNDTFNFLNYGIEKAHYNLNYYLEVIFTHNPTLPPRLYSYYDLKDIHKLLKPHCCNFTLLILKKKKTNSTEEENIKVFNESDIEIDFKKKYSIIKEISKNHSLRYITFIGDFLNYSRNAPLLKAQKDENKVLEVKELKQNIPGIIIKEVSELYKHNMDFKGFLDFITENDKLDIEINLNEEKLSLIEDENKEILDRIYSSMNNIN